MISAALFAFVLDALSITVTGSETMYENRFSPEDRYQVTIDNRCTIPIEFYWWNAQSGAGVLNGHLQPGERRVISTFPGHEFYFTLEDSKGNKENSLYEVSMRKGITYFALHDEDILIPTLTKLKYIKWKPYFAVIACSWVINFNCLIVFISVKLWTMSLGLSENNISITAALTFTAIHYYFFLPAAARL